MNTLNVRPLVEQAISKEWPTFAAEHPRLAAILHDDLLLESAVASLHDDPEYQQAMAHATAAGLAADALGDLVGRVVHRFLRGLLGS
ncbi:MAG TPA: hypothetical protein VGN72_22515 [Tepidisphaeraceae bacterium]|jgi:hypothetical protein|nr:hypothetical protein [Tepidisphaeraceae bacterium]